eukprot:g9142.t1 g9142   contig35:134273-134776(-)
MQLLDSCPLPQAQFASLSLLVQLRDSSVAAVVVDDHPDATAAADDDVNDRSTNYSGSMNNNNDDDNGPNVGEGIDGEDNGMDDDEQQQQLIIQNVSSDEIESNSHSVKMTQVRTTATTADGVGGDERSTSRGGGKHKFVPLYEKGMRVYYKSNKNTAVPSVMTVMVA